MVDVITIKPVRISILAKYFLWKEFLLHSYNPYDEVLDIFDDLWRNEYSVTFVTFFLGKHSTFIFEIKFPRKKIPDAWIE